MNRAEVSKQLSDNRKQNRNYLIAGLTLLVLVAVVLSIIQYERKQIHYGKGSVTIDNHTIKVQIADNEKAREKGLSGRDSLNADSGMLFEFLASGRYAFWMKDTRIPLDFIWIKAGKIVQITANVATELGLPDASLHSYLPAEEIDSMIEVNAGYASKNHLKVGQPISVDEK